MSYSKIEDEVEILRARLTRLEHQLPLNPNRVKFKSTLTADDILGVLGGFLTAVFGLGLLTAWLNHSIWSVFLAFGTTLGIWLSLRKSGFLGLSDSTIQLLREGRAQRKIKASPLHLSAQTRRSKLKNYPNRLYFSLGLVAALVSVFSVLGLFFIGDPIWQLLLPFSLTVMALVYAWKAHLEGLSLGLILAIFAMLLFNQVPLLALFILPILVLILLYSSWLEQKWFHILITILSFYSLIGIWLIFDNGQSSGWGISPLGNIALALIAEEVLFISIFLGIPFLMRRRLASEREVIRTILLINALGFSLIISWLTLKLFPSEWFLASSAMVLLAASFSGICWLQNGRFSYAKYFSVAALISLLIASVVYLEPTLMIMIWFMAAIIFLTIGFVLESYTARMLGLAALGGTFIHYLFSILPMQNNLFLLPYSLGIPAIFEIRIWLGSLLAAFLLLVAFWFQQLKTKGRESELRPYLVSILFASSGLVLLSLFILESINYL